MSLRESTGKQPSGIGYGPICGDRSKSGGEAKNLSQQAACTAQKTALYVFMFLSTAAIVIGALGLAMRSGQISKVFGQKGCIAALVAGGGVGLISTVLLCIHRTRILETLVDVGAATSGASSPEPEVLTATSESGASSPEPEVLTATSESGASSPEPEVLTATSESGASSPEPDDLTATSESGASSPEPEVLTANTEAEKVQLTLKFWRRPDTLCQIRNMEIGVCMYLNLEVKQIVGALAVRIRDPNESQVDAFGNPQMPKLRQYDVFSCPLKGRFYHKNGVIYWINENGDQTKVLDVKPEAAETKINAGLFNDVNKMDCQLRPIDSLLKYVEATDEQQLFAKIINLRTNPESPMFIIASIAGKVKIFIWTKSSLHVFVDKLLSFKTFDESSAENVLIDQRQLFYKVGAKFFVSPEYFTSMAAFKKEELKCMITIMKIDVGGQYFCFDNEEQAKLYLNNGSTALISYLSDKGDSYKKFGMRHTNVAVLKEPSKPLENDVSQIDSQGLGSTLETQSTDGLFVSAPYVIHEGETSSGECFTFKDKQWALRTNAFHECYVSKDEPYLVYVDDKGNVYPYDQKMHDEICEIHASQTQS